MWTFPLLHIIGASTRAAAMSARRAGWSSRCIDEFGDRDLAAIATVLRAGSSDWSQAIETAAATQTDFPWLYTGPLENHPDLVERLSALHRLLGNPAEVLRAVRDPCRVAAQLRREGLAHAEVHTEEADLPRDGTWLIKPRASGGGRLVQPLTTGSASLSEPCYYQRLIKGESCSAIFIAERGRARLLGACRQLHGGPSGPYAYRGNFGPIMLPELLKSRLSRLGAVLAGGFELAGLFGVDYILADGEPWLLEVNPRYTASVELIELALGRSVLREHMSGLQYQSDDKCHMSCESDTGGPPRRVVAKEVLYAERELIAPDLQATVFTDADPYRVPEVADIPWPGTCIARGDPILTVFAEGPEEPACLSRLREQVLRWRTFMEGPDRSTRRSP
jgi:predicted ATP-grasp superfamily ATP-dependent carboligase